MSLAWSAYRFAAPLIGAAAPALRPFTPAAERGLWGERMGRVAATGAVDAWIHAASLGEALAVGPLVRALSEAQPGARFHLTASTTGGRARLGESGQPHSLAPLDAPQAVARFMTAVRPRRLLLIETELWPHWLLRARATRVPVAVVSARLSAGSVPRYLGLGREFAALVAGLDAVLCQSAGDAARWRAIGSPAERTVVVGNLKDDALRDPGADGAPAGLDGSMAGRGSARAALGLDPDRPLLVLGSVRPDEVRLLARAWRRVAPELRARWQVVAAPRHPHAAEVLRREAASEGQRLVETGAPTGDAWRWDERLGVLPGYYGAADLSVVGGTLGPYGGHNPLEPAACGVAVIVGPHHASQADAVAALVSAGAARVATGETALTNALTAWLGDEGTRRAAGTAGLAVVRARRGAARRAVARLMEWSLWPAA
jgi:3-deoxy-D-manno-octulosonic-acid transferase